MDEIIPTKFPSTDTSILKLNQQMQRYRHVVLQYHSSEESLSITQISVQWKFHRSAVVDLHSKILDAPPSNFLHFHAVFGKIWPNNMLVSAPVGLVPFLWEILDLPLINVETFHLTLLFHTTRYNNHNFWIRRKLL